MASLRSTLSLIEGFRAAAQPFARYVIALIAGIAITFTQDHSTYTALEWLTVIVAVSLVFRDGPESILNRVAWWSTFVVVVMTGVGLLAGRMSTATALSLTIALVAFETSRAFTRSDRIWLWSTGVLAIGLSVLYFSVDSDDTTASGLTGGWAVIAGVFGLISAIDGRIKKSRAATAPKPAPRSTTSAVKPATASAPTKPKAKPRGTKR